MKKISEIRERLNNIEKITIAVPAAHDDAVLLACAHAAREEIIFPVLIGDKEKIECIMKEESIEPFECEIINEPDNKIAVGKAISLVREKKASIVMKGLVGTADFLKGILNKQTGLKIDGLLSHVCVFEHERYDRLLFLSDGAMNITPDCQEKIKIINNAVKVAKALDIETPKVALLSAVETVSFKMQSAVDAAIISKMSDRKQIKDCIVDGPLALDNAVSMESAKHKGIESKVAGQADILIVSEIEGGNILYKTLVYFSKVKIGAVISGASVPIVLTSRSDSEETKFNSIMLAAYLSQKN